MGRPNYGSRSNRQRGGHNGNGTPQGRGRGSSKGRGSASASASARSGGGGDSSSNSAVGLLGAAPPPSGHRHPPNQLSHQWHAPASAAAAAQPRSASASAAGVGAKRPRPAGLDGGSSDSKQVVVGLKGSPPQPALLVPAGAAAGGQQQQQQRRRKLMAAAPAPAATKMSTTRPPTSAQQQQQHRQAAGDSLRGAPGKQQAPPAATTRAHLNCFNCPKEGDAREGVELGFNFWVHTQTQVGFLCFGWSVWFWLYPWVSGGLLNKKKQQSVRSFRSIIPQNPPNLSICPSVHPNHQHPTLPKRKTDPTVGRAGRGDERAYFSGSSPAPSLPAGAWYVVVVYVFTCLRVYICSPTKWVGWCGIRPPIASVDRLLFS